jgi:hypothetical protein
VLSNFSRLRIVVFPVRAHAERISAVVAFSACSDARPSPKVRNTSAADGDERRSHKAASERGRIDRIDFSPLFC